jgi:very-short-patch-repair endonuclease
LVASADGRVIGSPDLLSVEHGVVGEYDGAEHRSRQRQREDVRREEAFRAEGLECFRVVGADLGDRALVVRRIRAAVDRAAAWGRPRTFRVRRGGRHG